MLQLKRKLQRSTEKGFTLLETLLAMLVATTFVAATMQAMVIAAYSRIRAQETSEATTLIQEDLEEVKYKAAVYQNTSLTETEESDETVLDVKSVYGFEEGDTVKVGSDSNTYTIATSGVDEDNSTITLESDLKKAASSGDSVVATTRCNGFADALRDEYYSGDETRDSFTKSGSNSGKEYIITRKLIPSKEQPNVLQVIYSVMPSSDDETVAEMYTEVIADAAFSCP